MAVREPRERMAAYLNFALKKQSGPPNKADVKGLMSGRPIIAIAVLQRDCRPFQRTCYILLLSMSAFRRRTRITE